MKKTIKIITTLSLTIVFLLICIVVLSAGYLGFWLHTYNVFTQREKVAEITISELKSDAAGQYADVKVNLVKPQSALNVLLGVNATASTEITEYKVYGDVIYIGGPIIKFRDSLILVNFKTIYKLGKIYGRYANNDMEISKSTEALQQSSYDINEGYEDWKTLFINLNEDGFLGRLYNSVVDITQLSEPGQFVSTKELKFDLFITNNGFVWDLVRE